MRVAFFEPAEDRLTSHRKGVLFEALTRRLVEASGYRDVQLRQKHNSLEYDVEAIHGLNGTRLTGEAKALERNIEGQVISAFVGKLLPLATTRLDGLFISVSPFTPAARDYVDAVESGGLGSLQLSLTTLVGDDIPRFFREHGKHVSEEVVRSRVRDALQLETFDVWLVVTERQEFFVATCGPNLVETPTHFAIFNTDGSELDLDDAIGSLQLQLPDLNGLALARAAVQPELPPRSERLPAVDVGAGWFDYRFPAPPDCFIGREGAVDEVQRAVEEIRSGATALRAIQILSRSGVGKSSLLLKLAAELPNASVVTVDARSVRVPSEVRLVVAALVERVNHDCALSVTPPRTQDDASSTLEAVGAALAQINRVGVIQLDQFESSLGLPAVFAAVLDLIATAATRNMPIVWIFARKNDLSVTFDESARIDLERLNNETKPIGLDDFLPPESSALLQRLAIELGRPLRPGLAEAISTFSAGFPWLHKRLCAHVLSMQNDGVSQDELMRQGLRAEDLFEEDMAGLGEADKALLRRLAAHLPATGGELARSLEPEISAERLRLKLNEFLNQKLLRLSGDVYDTYNDVFKTYLVTEQVPFKSRYIFRVSPKAALDLVPEIAEVGSTSVGNFQKHLGVSSRIALLNKLRELRLLGLISPERGRVALTPETKNAMESQRLGELLRVRLRGNALVVRVLDLVASEDALTMDDIADELRRELPHVHVEASTWKSYARQLAAWLDFSGLAYVEGESLRIREFPTDESLRGRDFYSARFVANTFMPSVRPDKIVELIEALRAGPLAQSAVYERWGGRHAPGMLRDAEALDL